VRGPTKKPTLAERRDATLAANKARRTQLPRAPHHADGDADDDAEIRLISKHEVVDRVGVAYPTLWQWMRKGCFPRARALGGKTVWIKSEIDAWLASLPKRALKGDEEAA
jgi:predicted DNA-binding transcriptional regulator AlpA